jgi:hypothetical protein
MHSLQTLLPSSVFLQFFSNVYSIGKGILNMPTSFTHLMNFVNNFKSSFEVQCLLLLKYHGPYMQIFIFIIINNSCSWFTLETIN